MLNFRSVSVLAILFVFIINAYCEEISTDVIPLPVKGLNENEAATEIYQDSSEWSNNWFKNFRQSFSDLRLRLGLATSNATTGLDTNRHFFHGARDRFQDYVGAIFPGTLWCGRGNRAKFYEELGRYSDTDSCCREHDECPDSIRAGESKYGLENSGLFTRSHCDCDLRFYNCLKKVGSIVSRQMGISYFNVLSPQCFRLDRPVRDCAMVYRSRCILYEFENTDQLQYQWFDVPKF